MGIPHLYSFVTREVPNSCFSIDILKEIDDWIRKHQTEPTIVFDFQAFSRAIDNDPIDPFYCCRSVQCYKKTEKFLKILTRQGVKLVFFDDGPMQMDKSQVVVKRYNDRNAEIFKVLDDLNECNLLIPMANKYKIGHRGSMAPGIEAVARKLGEFHQSYHNECDKELAAYATKVNALAIFSNDTDFLIFDGNWSYWSSNHINFDAMTTIKYNKNNIRRHLRLSQDEMPLLATLAGNDIISKDLLDNFHRKIGNPREKFYNISQYIIRNFRKETSYDPQFIAKQIFGNAHKLLPDYTKLVEKSLDSFNIRNFEIEPNDPNNLIHRLRTIKNDSYAYILDLARNWSISYFDVRTPEFEKYPPLSLNLIRRQLGIVLQHKNDKSLTRHIYCYENGQFIYKTIDPEYPSILVPDLNDLYFGNKNYELKLTKIRLLAWILSDRLDVNIIKSIKRRYFCVCLTLFYMVENGFITVREADIFLHMVESVHRKLSEINSLLYTIRLDTRAFQIVFLYDKFYQLVMRAIANCGLFDLIEQIHLDGLYFHTAYAKMHDEETTKNMNAHLDHLRLYKDFE